jgi:hypothetical protein
MYKKTQEQLDHIGRVASAATRPSARGIIRDIPTWAKAPEDYFNSLEQQFNIKNGQFKAAEERVKMLREQKALDKKTWPPTLQERCDEAIGRLAVLHAEMQRLRSLTHAASTNAWGTVFYLCCKELLDKEQFSKIDDEVKRMLNRERKPLDKLAFQNRKPVKNRIKTLKRKIASQSVVITTLRTKHKRKADRPPENSALNH